MSTAFYPLGMRTMPAGGRNSRATLPSQYITWKGDGSLSNPVGIAPSHIRPLTNNDIGNVYLSGNSPSRVFDNVRNFLPRPLKHYRKGRVIPPVPYPENSDYPPTNFEISRINYNNNRYVRSSTGSSLGGSQSGGGGLIGDLIDRPGAYVVKENKPDEISNNKSLNKDCKTCEGVGVIVNYYPNNRYLTNNPDAKTQTPKFCCNEEYKARRRVIYANTNLKKNYYTTHYQYLQNRCQTYNQKAFNFYDVYPPLSVNQAAGVNLAEKPGGPKSIDHTYLANCFPNAEIYDATVESLVSRFINRLYNNDIITEYDLNNFKKDYLFNFMDLQTFINTLPDEAKTMASNELNLFFSNPYTGMPIAGPTKLNQCKLTVYKPNNYQFAKQGAVSSSTRILKKQVDTISTNAASLQNNNNLGDQLVTANQIYRGNKYNVNLYKNKSQARCEAPPSALIQGVYTYQNKKVCHYQRMPKYQVPISQPSPYRDYIATVFHTNHYCQPPRTYINPSRRYQTRV